MHEINSIISGMQKTSLPSNYWDTHSTELPELEATRSVIQRNGHSVWEHTMSVIDLLSIKTPITLLSGLFHDLGKCFVSPMSSTSSPRFPGHADASANIAEIRLSEWGTSRSIIDRVVRIVSTHMFDISNAIREKTIRQFVANVGQDNIDNWFIVRIADSRSYTSQQRYRNHFIESFRRAVTSYMKQQPSFGHLELEQPKNTGNIQIRGGDSK